jgi:tetratricopeptide (TPR) repeat protein
MIMERIKRRSLPGIFAVTLFMQVFLPAAPGRADLRNVKLGDKMPEFSLPDSKGDTFTYKHGRDKVLALAFLPTTQRRIERELTDIETLIENIQENTGQFVFVCAISGPSAKDFSEPRKPDSKPTFPILIDSNFQLWGRLGVIAAPTLIIVGKDDTIQWIRAGYGYDFVPVVRAHLMQALGLAQEASVEEAQQVKAVTNDTVEARIQRHLQMAKMLEEKGRVESAIGELRKAAQLDPNSSAPILELGELFCRTGRNTEALNLAEKFNAANPSDKARRLLISGWARRQMGELDTAEKLLRETLALDPTSIRALFELGKIYQTRGQTEKAMQSYYTALTLFFKESGKEKILINKKN